eukprot:scaffold226271_cov61-Cyclotella_meneghiniana.AAC.2
MAMEDEPVRSLSSEMALTIPALYDMMVVKKGTARRPITSTLKSKQHRSKSGSITSQSIYVEHVCLFKRRSPAE